MPFLWKIPLRADWRDRLDFDGLAATATDDRALADALAARLAAHWPQGQPPSAADVYAVGLIAAALRLILRQYEMQTPGLFVRALQRLDEAIGARRVDAVLQSLLRLFPPEDGLRSREAVERWLRGGSPDRPHRAAALEEGLLLWLDNQNPAWMPLRPLFDDRPLRETTPYSALMEALQAALLDEPALISTGETLLDVLRAPVVAAPHSLDGQLTYLVDRWGAVLGESFVRRLLRARDYWQETLPPPPGAGGAGPPQPPVYDEMPAEEGFSLDRDWMPQLVLLARNTYVWLAQLSRKYGRPVQRLDQIPDAELDWLADSGFSGLWLIGLWERSRASARIKQLMGDEEAAASAYALYDYVIAADLGGEAALADLQRRAAARGLRLAADMVPNHMGIDSRWVIEHPDWFLSLDEPPFPGYTFTGPDLSSDPRVGIFLEDHYYDRSDAAVVFKWEDRRTGQVRYIYHGNDGTSMPWNDTAQLNYLHPGVREQVIETILQVARRFPIIRFDAAMTLAKKHIQRLWFPAPGEGGAIPSRAAHGLTREEFNRRMPREFWREVVDRVAQEAPDTLLLAEAFWMMEGYFVRTLGMHRVYNSAFMHMTRDEDNARYRQLLKDTLAFDPQILKRFVNFMNNPDEDTAAVQFGTTEKYFGVCTLMVTLPGLPLFGHGQVEGFREKYGMEFRAPRWQERVDEALVRGHEQRIFPLLHRRRLFAGVEAFVLYDFFTAEGRVDENVFAYSNRLGEERALVVYHNRYAQTSGWVRGSVPWQREGELHQCNLAEGLALPAHGYVIFRDLVSGQEFIRSCRLLAEEGFYLSLTAYQAAVFLDFRFVEGANWALVHDMLAGRGVQDMDAFYEEVFSPATMPVAGAETPSPVEEASAPRENTVPDAYSPRS